MNDYGMSQGGEGGIGGEVFATAGENGRIWTTPGVKGKRGVGPNDGGMGGTGGVSIANSIQGEDAHAYATGGEGGIASGIGSGYGGEGGVARSRAIGGGDATSYSTGGGAGGGEHGNPGKASLSEAHAEDGGHARATAVTGNAYAKSVGGNAAAMAFASGTPKEYINQMVGEGGAGQGNNFDNKVEPPHGNSGEAVLSEVQSKRGGHSRATAVNGSAHAKSVGGDAEAISYGPGWIKSWFGGYFRSGGNDNGARGQAIAESIGGRAVAITTNGQSATAYGTKGGKATCTW